MTTLKLVEVKLTKTTLYLYEAELIAVIPAEMLEQGIRRGKAIKRATNKREVKLPKKYL